MAHFPIHLPQQGLGYGPIPNLTAYRFEAEHQPNKASARDSNRINTAKSIAIFHAKANAEAYFNRRLDRDAIQCLRKPICRHHVCQEDLSAARSDEEREVLTAVLKLAGGATMPSGKVWIEWHDALKAIGKIIEVGQWVIIQWKPESEPEREPEPRIYHVKALFSVEGQWIAFFNSYPPSSLVKLQCGRWVTQDPNILSDVPCAEEQFRKCLTPSQIEIILPVYLVKLSDQLAYFVPQ